MSNKIHLLPQSIANHIAAGEVAPNPSYVVKELLENAVDSGAKNIRIEIMAGGRDSISITDDGCGMSAHDARMAFERHATSKLKTIEDLDNIKTFGFRGEALAAICAVTQIDMKTRREEDQIGTHIVIHGGKLISCEPCTTPKGTTIVAKNIFFNVPARRKFLKDASKEERKIIKEVEHVAFIYNDINISLYSAGKIIIDLKATSLLNRISAITNSDKIKKELLPINFEGAENGAFSLSGFIGIPAFAKQNTGYVHQYMFANGRYIEHKYLQNQIKIAYQGLILSNQHPHYFIYLNIPTDELDVNIHPTKIQVRFAQEYTIGEYLRRLIREVLSANAKIPVIDFDNQSYVDIPAYRQDNSHKVEQESKGWNDVEKKTLKCYRSFGSVDNYDAQPKVTKTDFLQDWDSLGRNFENNTESFARIFDSKEVDDVENFESKTDLKNSFMVKDKYIVTSLFDGITIIDIQSAQERILYDRYFNNIQNAISDASNIHHIEPIKLDFEYQERDNAIKVLDYLSSLGFDFSDLGGGTFSILATPCNITPDNCKSIIYQIMDLLNDLDDINNIASSHIAQFIAKEEAKGFRLHSTEIQGFISSLLQTANPNITESGDIIYKTMKDIDISKLFNK